MAWLLRFDGINDYVSTPLAPNLTAGFDITVDFVTNSTSVQRIVDAEGAGHIELNGGAANQIRCVAAFQAAGFVTIDMPNSLILGQRQAVRLVYDRSTLRAFVDGALIDSRSVVERNIVFASPTYTIGRQASNNTRLFNGDLYSVDITTGTTVATYDPAASNGTGLILSDTTGTNDGTLPTSVWPSDNSQWVSTGPVGGVSSSIAFDISEPLFDINLSATLPSTESVVNLVITEPIFDIQTSATLPNPEVSIDFEVPEPVFNIQVEVELPNPSANISFTVAEPEFDIQTSATLPQPSATIEFEIPRPVFDIRIDADLLNPNSIINLVIPEPVFNIQAEATLPNTVAEINLTIPEPEFDINVSSTLPNPESSIAFSIPEPIFDIQLTVDGAIRSQIDLTIPSPIFDIQVDATLPNPQSVFNFSIPSPEFNISVLVGELIISDSRENRVFIEDLSNRVEITNLSNKIYIQGK